MKNCFDRTPHTMKDWLLLAAGVAAVFAAADWLPGVLRGAGAFLGLLAPFGWGLLLAYVLDIPTRFFAQKLFGGRRGGAMAVSYALFFGALALLAALVVPQLVQSVTTFAGRLGAYEETIRGLLVWVQNTFGIDTATAEQLVQMVGTALQNWFGGLSAVRRVRRRISSPARRGLWATPWWHWPPASTCSPARRRCSARPGRVCTRRCRRVPRAVCWKSAVLPTKFSAATSAGSWWTPCSWAGKHLR